MFAGQTYGRLTAVRFSHRAHGSDYWEFVCACGKRGHITKARIVEQGIVKGCGCIKHETRNGYKHGGKGTKLYSVWKGMRKRCYGNDRAHRRYRECGIRVCVEWDDFAAFKAWALLHGYREDLELDRADNSGDYHPLNCRWVGRSAQMRNTSKTRFVEWQGERIAARDLIEGKMSRETFYRRLERGWSVEEALLTPVGAPRRVEVAA